MSLSNSGHNCGNESSAIKSILWATTSFGLLWAYILCVAFLDETIAGVKILVPHIMIAALAGFVFLCVLLTWAGNRRVLANTAIRDASLGASSVVVGLVL